MQKQINKLDFSGQNIYSGIDTHKNQWTITVMVEDRLYKTFSQPSNPETFYRYLTKNFPGGVYHSAYEAGFCGFWPHFKLQEFGVNSIVVNPSDIPTTDKEKRQKDDPRDSKKIARSLQNGELQGIYIPKRETLEDRLLVRTRFTFVKELTRFKNRVKSLLNLHGITLPPEFGNNRAYWSRRFISWLESIEFSQPSATQALHIIIDQCKHLRKNQLEITRRIRELSKTEKYNKYFNLLISIPGIGPTITMLVLTEIEDIKRFKNLDQLCSFIGLIPSTKSSGDKEKTGDITARGHKLLRRLIVEAAWVAIKNDPALMLSFTNYTKRMNPNKAIVRIGKKLLNRIRFVLINEQEYVSAIVQ